ncbi:glycosyltransferase family 4 protein [Cryobacterium sp. 1639]|uniref:glycosyltransferase family 4 protein n=1 Tax=Cryobacterium inferilacus TaxID=2866629 RepID=UPI001C7384E7|nr:glycosyltransferase family 4 protein [Cryobacterium sp. 1639]MBX0301962.1 glycosyltransferase family 4 protein [Cryobacterium sp. 1639]
MNHTSGLSNRVCFVAAPLTARTGVYKSSRELVAEARAQGLDWSLVLGVSARASGKAPADDPSWIQETTVEPSGLGGVARLAAELQASPVVANSDVVVSLLPQTDMALARTNLDWVAYLRGLPWPAAGESSLARRTVWRMLERHALGRASDVWATTELLRSQANLRRQVRLVPAGLQAVARQWDGSGDRNKIVWAARYDTDKNPELFLEAMRGLPLRGVMYGSGPLEDDLRAAAPDNVEVAGWTDAASLWDGALAYVGTSHREAFGRSAVEASMAGIPVVLADTFGSASLLVKDPELSRRLVLPTGQSAPWSQALMSLSNDASFRRRVSDHVVENGSALTVERSVQAAAAALGDR